MSSQLGPIDHPTRYAYPSDLARFVQEHWVVSSTAGSASAAPEFDTLKHLFSICYQASLLRDEERPVTFRVILAPPELFSPDGMPPEHLQRLEFNEPFSLESSELRRLSVAADTQRTLIGVQEDAAGTLHIWGLVNSGARWLRDTNGGRRAGSPLPAVPVVHVDAPGNLTVYRGQELVARLRSGRLSVTRLDPFVSEWISKRFIDFRDDMAARHAVAREKSGVPWAPLELGLWGAISRRMMQRAIALIRQAHHGGTIIFVPSDSCDPSTDEPLIDLKYRFTISPTQRSFPDLVVSILNRLAQIHGTGPRPNDPVGWHEFETTPDHDLATLDEALFETAQLIAGLASTDGAVVLTKLHDILGFGGMISGRLPAVRRVARALDLDADSTVDESAENVGARHRSAYRLVAANPGAIVIVVSQDGGVRFVAQKEGRVTYLEQE